MNIKEISPEEVFHKMTEKKSFHLIDVREMEEWAHGHLEGAIHIPRGELPREIQISVPNLSEEVILYCAAGHRSALAAETLEQLGYQQVFSMAGGLRLWLTQHLPVQTF